MSMSKNNEVIVKAYEAGVRVDDLGKTYKLYPDRDGYPRFKITIDGEHYFLAAHRFAAYSYFGKVALEAECVRHLNGNPADFSKPNISYGTHRENTMDIPAEVRSRRSLAGGSVAGKKRRTMTEEQVRYIRNSPLSQEKLAKELGVKRGTIRKIKEYKTYKEVRHGRSNLETGRQMP